MDEAIHIELKVPKHHMLHKLDCYVGAKMMKAIGHGVVRTTRLQHLSVIVRDA